VWAAAWTRPRDDQAEGGDEKVPALAEDEGGDVPQRAEAAGVVENVLEVDVLAAAPALGVEPGVEALARQRDGDRERDPGERPAEQVAAQQREREQ
jgi:hypothetical protein